MIQKCVVDCDWVGGIREVGKSGGLSWGDQLLGHPDVVRGGFCKKIGPVGGLSSFDGIQVAELGLSCYSIGVGGAQLLGPAGGF